MNFGHHEDPAIDFVSEVEMIESEIADRVAGMPATFNLGERIARAMQFKVGGDPAAVVAKSDLRKMELAFRAGAGGATPAAASVSGGPNPLEVSEAIHAAAAAIYFTDSSDYLKALWAVLRKLAPGVADVLEKNPRGVFDENMNLRPAGGALSQAPAEESLMALIDRVARKWDGYMFPDGDTGGDFDIGEAVRVEFVKALAGRELPVGELPVAHLRSITHPDWLEVCDKGATGAFPVYATAMPDLRMPSEEDLMQAQIQSGADDLDRCHQAIRMFCLVNGLKLVIDGKEEQGDSYDALWNALQRIDTAVCMLPMMEVRHEGGIDAVVQNIVEAIAAASKKLEAAQDGEKRQRVLLQALQGMVDEFIKVYPIYYYAEPWAHNRNLALRFAQAVLADLGAAVGAVPQKTQVATFLRGAGLASPTADTAAGELIHYFAKGEWLPIVEGDGR